MKRLKKSENCKCLWHSWGELLLWLEVDVILKLQFKELDLWRGPNFPSLESTSALSSQQVPQHFLSHYLSCLRPRRASGLKTRQKSKCGPANATSLASADTLFVFTPRYLAVIRTPCFPHRRQVVRVWGGGGAERCWGVVNVCCRWRGCTLARADFLLADILGRTYFSSGNSYVRVPYLSLWFIAHWASSPRFFVNHAESAASLKNGKNFLFPAGGWVLQWEQGTTLLCSYYVRDFSLSFV